jgi:prepilin-type N-terminal cleavage/methylation domain-containing protein/prepilin-type processing-associated H-X9-DG protein
MINEGKIMFNKSVHLGIVSRPRPCGFTLIELLVVVAIIALLVSILLPSLKKARDQAKTVVCGNQLSQMIRAEILYEEQHKGWIPGTPMSTGYWFVANPVSTNGGIWVAGGNGQPRLVSWFDWFTPLRIQMHGPKSLPDTQMGLFAQGVDGIFNCPSNPHIAVWTPYGLIGGEDEKPGGPIRAISYLPMKNLMLPRRSGVPASYKSLPEYNKGRLTQDDSGPVVAPASYAPRRSKLGRPSVKVFLVDGTRRVDLASGSIYYMTPMRGSRCGVYPRTVPSEEVIAKIGWPRNTATWRGAWTAGRKLSYRHGDNNKMNAAFFDGHVQTLWVSFGNQRDFNEAGFPAPSNAGSAGYRNFTGPAVTPHFYYPSGSVVNKPQLLFKDTIPQGIKLQ